MDRRSQDITLILIGHPGSGKSATGNAIAGKKVFKTGVGSVRITNDVQSTHIPPYITVLDTPGLETAADYDKIKDKLKSKTKGNAIYLLIIRTGRFTQEEKKMLEDLFKKKKELHGNTLIIFTNAKELSNVDNVAANQTFDTWLKDVPNLKKIIDTYQLQYTQFENVNGTQQEKTKQVHDLFAILEIGHAESQTAKLVDFDSETPYPKQLKKQEESIPITRKEMEPFGQFALDFWDSKRKK